MSKTILQSGKEVSYTYDKLERLTSKNINSNAPINSSYTYKSSLRGTVDGKTYTTTPDPTRGILIYNVKKEPFVCFTEGSLL